MYQSGIKMSSIYAPYENSYLSID